LDKSMGWWCGDWTWQWGIW